ncbi:hypothetical protein ACFQ2B_11835 [Streptomyces stramineus]
MGEEGYGRPHALVGGEVDDRVGFRGPFDQHGVRPELLQRRPDGPRGARAVVADAEQRRAGAARGPAHAETSRQAR